MYAFVSEERKPQKRNLFQLLKKLRLVLQPLMNSSPKLENLWHWRSHNHLQTSSCPKRDPKNVVAPITASNSASWPHSDLTRHRPSSVAKILNAKLKIFFCKKKNLNLGHAATKGSVRVGLFEEVLDQRGGALRSHKVVSTIAVSVAFHLLVTFDKKCGQYIGRKNYEKGLNPVEVDRLEQSS